ncbi:MAG: hypothetical protein RRZ69_06865, partial [Clostridia bacterium]
GNGNVNKEGGDNGGGNDEVLYGGNESNSDNSANDTKEDDASAPTKLYLKISNRNQFSQLAELIELNPGKVEVCIQFDTKLYQFPSKVKLSGRLELQLTAMLGQNCVKTK